MAHAVMQSIPDKELSDLIDRAVTDGIPEDELDILVDEYKKSKEPGAVTKFARGADKRIGEIFEGAKAIPHSIANTFIDMEGTGQARPVGEAADRIGDALWNIPGQVWQGVKDTASNALSGDPERMGSAATDIVSSALPVSRAASVPTKAAGRAVGAGLRNPVGAAVMKRAGSQGGIWSILNDLRGGIADTLDPPRISPSAQEFLDSIPNTPIPSSPRIDVSGRPLPAPRLRLQNEGGFREPKGKTPYTVDAGPQEYTPSEVPLWKQTESVPEVDRTAPPADVSGRTMPLRMQNDMPQAPVERVPYTTRGPRAPQRAPGSLDAETAALVQEYMERANHGVGGFSKLPNVSPAELTRIKLAMDEIMKKGSH